MTRHHPRAVIDVPGPLTEGLGRYGFTVDRVRTGAAGLADPAAALRRKLGDPCWITTARGVGFRLTVPGDHTAAEASG
ncbi:hypothetical protein ACF1B0_35680 [Streptomyces anandii]|uniref:hypothetical protein n=1 Tax=Streptomyces anandii TaxID=285454 RepID=UPI0036FB617E